MKTLYAGNEILEAERIVKKSNVIVGYVGENEVFSFRGINDWSQFRLAEGQDWDVDEKDALASYLLDLDFRISLLELGVI